LAWLLVDATASLHDKVNTLCWLVGESQADRDEILPGKFNSADDLFNVLLTSPISGESPPIR
jgi:hypothetical protein